MTERCVLVHTSDMTPFWVTDSTLGDCGAEYVPGRGHNVARNVLPSRRCSPGKKSSNKIKRLKQTLDTKIHYNIDLI